MPFSYFLYRIASVERNVSKKHLEVSRFEIFNRSSLPFFVGKDLEPTWEVNQPILEVGDFELINQHEQKITQINLDGKITIANFFFTSCPNICGRMMQNLKKLNSLLEENPSLQIFSHSVTPTRDTPRMLRLYAGKLEIKNPRWQLLTGKTNEVFEVARNSYHADTRLEESVATDDFIHSENLYLVDGQRRIRGIYNGLSANDMDLLASDVALLNRHSRNL